MAEALWQMGQLVTAAGGRLDGEPQRPITGFSIDTRSLLAGDVFVALKDARDGHEFVSAAFTAGAAAALVSQSYARQPGDGCLIRVDDPLRALERIGIAARARLAPETHVVAVTGSAGKTGTKEMLRACLAPFGATHAPDKSFNNHWGVPLTLARMPAATRYAIFEIGMNHAGEITPLTRMVRPHVAIITNVLPVHVGNFPDGEAGVAAAKAEVLLGLQPTGVAVLPRDSAHFEMLAGRARALGLRVVSFGGSAHADYQAENIFLEPNASRVSLRAGDRRIAFEVGASGRHLAINALSVAATLDGLGLPLAAALAPLAGVRAPVGRGARSLIAVGGGHALLIDESYNANPASVKAALAAMAGVPRADFGRRLAVLGDMLELGAQAPAAHLGLKEAIDDAGTDLVFAAGPMMQLLYETLDPMRRAAWAATAADLTPRVMEAIRPGDVIMVKGSLGSRMGPIVAALMSAAGEAG